MRNIEKDAIHLLNSWQRLLAQVANYYVDIFSLTEVLERNYVIIAVF
jgi:hypothetical protein